MGAQTGCSCVLAALDGSPHDPGVTDWAAAEASRRQAPLRLAHVVPAPDCAAHAYQVLALAHERASLRAGPGGVSDVVRFGAVVPTLLAAAADAAVIVLGSGQHVSRQQVALGSALVHVTAHAPCPVVVVRHQQGGTPVAAAAGQQVVVGVDGSPMSQEAIGFAFDAASARGLGVRAVHAWLAPLAWALPAGSDATRGRHHEQLARQAARRLAEELSGWRAKYPSVPVTERVCWDRPAHALIEASEGAPLLVVGCHGQGHFPGMLLGSVSQSLLRYSPASLAVVRPRR